MKVWLRRIGGAGLVVLTLIVGQAIIRTKPSTNDLAEPFLISGRIDQDVTVDGIIVHLLGVRGATRIKQPNNSFVLDSQGVWIIVRLRLTATTTTSSIGYLAVADRQGRTFRATKRYRQTVGEGIPRLQPDIPIEGEVLFEVPRTSASRLDLRASQAVGAISRNGLERRAVADIPIPIPGRDVIYWAADPTPAELMVPKVGG